MTPVVLCKEEPELQLVRQAFLDVTYGVTVLEERTNDIVTPGDVIVLARG